MRYAIFALLALALAACANRKNPYYCDESSDCSHLRGQSFCDIDALLPGTQLRNTCVAPPDSEQCNRAQACTSAARPQCSDDSAGAMGTCVECTLNEHCEGDCDTESHTCLPPIIPCMPGSAGDSDCVSANADKPYCAAIDTCSECSLSMHCLQAAASVCDPLEFSCRACEKNPECDSLYCETETGLCADTLSLIYVDSMGTGSACTQEAPCATISVALDQVSAARRRIVVQAADYSEQLDINDLDVEIVGIGAARITPVLGDGDNVLRITGNSSVSLTDIEIRPNSAALGTDAIRCDGSNTSLSLERVNVFGSRDLGILATDCVLKINASQLIANGGGAVFIMGSGGFSITNSIIAHNVTTNGRPAVELTTSALQHFDFNTVVGNFSTGLSAGVTCSTSPALVGTGNIIYGNTGGAAFSGNCQWQFSDVEGIAATNDNISLDPQLEENFAFGDYHLRSTSPCIDAAGGSQTPSTDIDGEIRPQGPAPDMGADESQ